MEISTSKDKLRTDNEFLEKYLSDKASEYGDIPNDPDNLEYLLRTEPYFLEKARASEVYAQHIYAALCNNQFQHVTSWNILSDKFWSCSWRYAGGIVAHMRQEGDYMDWYCSGYGPDSDIDNPNLTPDQKAHLEIAKQFLSEGIVSDEFKEDLAKFNWVNVPYDDKDLFL